MRNIVIASVAAAGVGLALSSAASAAPVNAAVLGAQATDEATTVQYYYRYRPYYYYSRPYYNYYRPYYRYHYRRYY
jgi:hypothetical protein